MAVADHTLRVDALNASGSADVRIGDASYDCRYDSRQDTFSNINTLHRTSNQYNTQILPEHSGEGEGIAIAVLRSVCVAVLSQLIAHVVTTTAGGSASRLSSSQRSPACAPGDHPNLESQDEMPTSYTIPEYDARGRIYGGLVVYDDDD
ncbi:hypothetical protein LTR95_002781 [Oleoguttula sp. CCFEE 5521]